MKIPFVGGSNEGRSTPWDGTRSVNLFVESGSEGSLSPSALVGTPGTALFASFPAGKVRMLHVMVDRCFVVVGRHLYEVYADGSHSDILGTFPGPAFVAEDVIAVDNGVSAQGVGGDQILMLDRGYGYIYDISTSAFLEVSDENFPSGAVQAAFMDGYFIVTDSSMAHYASELYEGLVWPALAKGAALSTSDDIVALVASNQLLYLIKESATEIWQNAEIPTSQGCPFRRIPGSMMTFGTVAGNSVSLCGDVFLMLATTRVQNSAAYFGVVAVSGTTVQKVSTAAIDYKISRLTSHSDAISYSYVDEGHLFYVLTFPTDDWTIVYDMSTKEWHERSTHIPEIQYKQHRHLSHKYAYFAGKHLVSHYASPSLYQMSSTFYDDAGVSIIRERVAQPIFDPQEGRDVAITKLVIDAETGVGDGTISPSGAPTAWLSWSNDGGKTWSAQYEASLGRQGEYGVRLVWRRLGKARNRVFRLRISDAVKVVLMNAVVNDGAVL